MNKRKSESALERVFVYEGTCYLQFEMARVKECWNRMAPSARELNDSQDMSTAVTCWRIEENGGQHENTKPKVHSD